MAGFHLTPDIVEAAYELLRTTPPFRGWKLPHADDVAFHVIPLRDRFSDFHHWYDRGKPRKGWTIRVDPRACKSTPTLMLVMAHEMCHLREAILGVRLDVEHSATFKRLADQVCRYHNFDRGAF